MVIYMNNCEPFRRLQPEEQIGARRHAAVQRRRAENFPLHWHNYFEIEIILSGTGRHFFNGTEHRLSRGTCYLLTPVDFHEVQVQEPVELINISFDETCLSEQMLQLLPAAAKILQEAEGALERLVMAAKLLEYECESDGSCKTQLLEYLLSGFLRKEQRATSQAQLTGIGRAISYMELHFREKITLEQLSRLSGYNPTYFSELFRKVTGQSYIQRLKELRLRYAAMLLRSGLSVSDVCYASGFCSLSNFLAAFKKKYGVAPKAFSNTYIASKQ